MRIFFVLGRTPALSISEIRASVSKNARLVSPWAAILDEQTSVQKNSDAVEFQQSLIKKLGGAVKTGTVLKNLKKEELEEEELARFISEILQNKKTAGKINFGISVYAGLGGDREWSGNKKQKYSEGLGYIVKALLKKTGRGARFVHGKDGALSSVQVEKNKLLEFVLMEDLGGGNFGGGALKQGQSSFLIGLTSAVQEFEEFSFRDYMRPGRDPKRGMLPPKLARAMINLGWTNTTSAALLDPFCGSGTTLSEAMLLGFKNLFGSDIEQKAVDDTTKNIEWTRKTKKFAELEKDGGDKISFCVTKCDVREADKCFRDTKFDLIVTESFLGKPLSGKEMPTELKSQAEELKKLYFASLKSFKKILKPGGRVIMAVPAFGQSKEGRIFTAIQKDGENLGYKSLIYIVDAKETKMLHHDPKLGILYQREGQLLGRVILAFEAP